MSSKGSYFRRKRGKFWMFLIVLTVLVTFKAVNWDSLIGLKNGPRSAQAGPGKDDWNRDGVVDLGDVQFFSTEVLFEDDWENFDWCSWVDGNSRERKHMGPLLEAFVRDYFQCDVGPGEDPLLVKHSLVYPMRLALGPVAAETPYKLYVTDPKIGSVFIHDVDFNIIGELKELDKPLGLAVDGVGNIYVGNSGRKNVEVYDSKGFQIATIGKGLIKMPNDLVFDNDGRLYVADSKNDTIWVFGANGGVIRSIGTPGEGDGQFRFPIAVEIGYYGEPGQEVGELYVADHGHSLVKVFDLEGNFLRSFGGMPIKSGMWRITWEWEGKFVSVQSLAIDHLGQLHALDCFLDHAQILDPADGTYLEYYGENGTEPGQLNLPSDIIIDGYGRVIVAESRNKRVEVIYTIP